MARQFIVIGRFSFSGTAIVEAESIDEAKRKFDDGDFEFDADNAECIDWERHRIEDGGESR